MVKCSKISCNNKAIIRFEYKQYKESYCLDHLVERLDYIKENNLVHLIIDAIKIIPIFNF